MTAMTCNRQIACEPFPDMSPKMEIKAGFAKAIQKQSVQSLKVLVDHYMVQGGNTIKMVSAGDSILVRADHFTTLWAKAVFDVLGKKTIFVPEEEVLVLVPQVASGTTVS